MVLPIGPNPARCPVRALRTWPELAAISSGPVFRPVSTGNRALARRLSAQTVNYLVQGAIKWAGIDPLPYSAHSLRAGFVTTHTCGAPATGPSPTRPGTAPWRPWGSKGSTRHGKITPLRSSD